MEKSDPAPGMDTFRSGIRDRHSGSITLALWNVNMLGRVESDASHFMLQYMDEVRCNENNRHKEYSHLGWRSYGHCQQCTYQYFSSNLLRQIQCKICQGMIQFKLSVNISKCLTKKLASFLI
jgi:hypothetical protein